RAAAGAGPGGSGGPVRAAMMSRAARIRLLWVLAVATVSALWWVPPIPQSLAYHDFADRRSLLGLPNALNVLSNLPFLLVGAAGLTFILRGPPSPAGPPFLARA